MKIQSVLYIIMATAYAQKEAKFLVLIEQNKQVYT